MTIERPCASCGEATHIDDLIDGEGGWCLTCIIVYWRVATGRELQ